MFPARMAPRKYVLFNYSALYKQKQLNMCLGVTSAERQLQLFIVQQPLQRSELVMIQGRDTIVFITFSPLVWPHIESLHKSPP